jgi:outer membrane protein
MLIPAEDEIEILVPEMEIEGEAIVDVNPNQVFNTALETQPEITSAELGVRSALLGVKVAKASLTPTLSLGGSFRTNYSDAFDQRFITDPNAPPTFQSSGLITADGVDVLRPSPQGEVVEFGFADQFEENLSQNLGLSLNIPIFNGLQARTNMQRAKITLQQAEITKQERQNFLRQDIETAYNNVQAASKSYEASLRQVDALEETFRAIENQYNLGAANFTDYQVASNNLFRAKSDLVRSKYEYIFRKKILDFYQGNSLTIDQ